MGFDSYITKLYKKSDLTDYRKTSFTYFHKFIFNILSMIIKRPYPKFKKCQQNYT